MFVFLLKNCVLPKLFRLLFFFRLSNLLLSHFQSNTIFLLHWLAQNAQNLNGSHSFSWQEYFVIFSFPLDRFRPILNRLNSLICLERKKFVCACVFVLRMKGSFFSSFFGLIGFVLCYIRPSGFILFPLLNKEYFLFVFCGRGELFFRLKKVPFKPKKKVPLAHKIQIRSILCSTKETI